MINIPPDITLQMLLPFVPLFGAVATIIGSLIQLRIAWRKELLARVEKKPVNKKSKRGPVIAVLVLLVASAISGFVLSHYWVAHDRKIDKALETELRNRIDTLTNAAQRIENVRLAAKDDMLKLLRIEESVRLGKQGVTSIINISACKPLVESTAVICSEQQSQRFQLCVELPEDALISTIDLFAFHNDGNAHHWQESRVMPGADFGGGRFIEKPNEQTNLSAAKLICQDLIYWNTEVGLQARMVVHYVPNLD